MQDVGYKIRKNDTKHRIEDTYIMSMSMRMRSVRSPMLSNPDRQHYTGYNI